MVTKIDEVDELDNMPDSAFQESMEEELPLSREDLLLAVRKMRIFTEEKLRSMDVERRKEVTSLQHAIQSLVEQVSSLRSELQKQGGETGAMSADVVKATSESKSLRDFMEKKLESVQKNLFETVMEQKSEQERWLNKKLQALDTKHGDGIASAQKAFSMGEESMFERVKSLLDTHARSMPPPHITNVFPEKAIRIEQSTPQVSVNVPQQAAPQVNVKDIRLVMDEKSFNVVLDQPAPHVHLPEGAITIKQLPSVVNLPEGAIQIKQMPAVVNVPEQAPPIVNVNTPRRKSIKTIEYDGQSRPSRVLEEEITEEDEGA